MTIKFPIFMDNHSTTPVDRRVVDEMLPYFTEVFGNAASRNHPFVEALCQSVMARSLGRERTGGAARAAVMRSWEVSTQPTRLLFRCRNVLGEQPCPARSAA